MIATYEHAGYIIIHLCRHLAFLFRINRCARERERDGKLKQHVTKSLSANCFFSDQIKTTIKAHEVDYVATRAKSVRAELLYGIDDSLSIELVRILIILFV